MRPIPALPALAWLSLSLVGCNTLVGTDPQLTPIQRDQAQRGMTMPQLVADPSYEIATASTDVPVSLQAFTRWFVETGAPNFGSFLNSSPTVPGVTRTEPLIGAWRKSDDRRRLMFVDGSSVIEQILPDSTPQRFRSVIWNRTDNMGRYVAYALSEFRITKTPLGTRVIWTYAFQPKAQPPDGWFIRSFVRTDFTEFMKAGLDAMRVRAMADHGFKAQ